MNKIKKWVLYWGVFFVRQLSKILFIFPIEKNKYLFSSYSGRAFSCSPKEIFEKIFNQQKDSAKYVWRLSNADDLPEKYRKNVKIVGKMSLSFFYHYITSEYIITNSYIPPFIAKRKKQTIIETWHGGGSYKIVGTRVKNISNLQKQCLDIMSRYATYFLSSCKKSDIWINEDMHIDKNKIIKSGLPRNDVFFNEKYVSETAKEVREKLKISSDTKIILYAPTFRGGKDLSDGVYNQFSKQLDVLRMLKAFEKRFNQKFQLLIREHPPVEPTLLENSIDVTSWPDIQPLLCAADFFITDYSSCMWDYALLNRPGFLFVPDLEDYLDDRGFYMPIETWPYPFAKDNNTLEKLIEEFDYQTSKEKIAKHLKEFGSYENGSATQKAVELLEEVRKEN